MRRIAFLCLLATVFPALAFTPGVRWLETEYDFGVIKEAAGPVTGSVRFVNDSPEEIFVARVRPTCGCTDAHGPEEGVAPGDTARIVFTYDPTGRPGNFRKSIRVVFIGSETPDEIALKGTVIARPGSLDAKYPVAAGPLRLSMDEVHFGDLPLGDSRYLFISGFNNSDKTLHPTVSDAAKGSMPFPVDVVMSADSVAPGEMLTIGFYLHTSPTLAAADVNLYGLIASEKLLCVDADCIPITLDAEIMPAVAQSLTDEIGKGAPQVAITPDIIDLGTSLRTDRPTDFTLNIANTGITPLHVKKIYSDDGNVKPIRYPSALKKGKRDKALLRLTPDASAQPGDIVSGFVTIITDDPLTPVIRIKFAGQYKK